MSQVNRDTEKRSLPFFGIGKVLPYMKKYAKVTILMVACGLSSTGVDLLIPQFQRYALNHFIAEKTLDTLPFFIALYVAILLLMGVLNYVSCFHAMRTEVSVNRDLRNAAFSHLQTLSFSYFNQNSVGYIHARVISDTSRIGSLVSWSLMDSVWHLSYLVGAVVILEFSSRTSRLMRISLVWKMENKTTIRGRMVMTISAKLVLTISMTTTAPTR